MKKTSIVVHQNYVEYVIKKLHETGLMEIINISKEQPGILEDAEKPTISSEASVCANYELRLSRLIGILNKLKPKKSGIKSFLKPDLPEIRKVEDRPLEEIYSNAEGVLAEIENQILENNQKLTELNEQIDRITLDLSQLNYLRDFELDISDIGESDYLFIKVGKTEDFEKIQTQIKELEKTTVFSKQFGSGKKIEWAVILVSHISEKSKVEKICRENVSEFNFDVSTGVPKELTKSLKKDIQNIENEKKRIVDFLKKYVKKHLPDLLVLREEIQLERIRLEIPKNFAKTTSTYLIDGWVLEKNQDELKTFLQAVSKDFIDFDFKTPSPNPDNPPTYFTTPRWAEGFKGLVSMFATPKYNEINPTIIMGIFFILFFSIMLGDAGYGLVILFLSLFGYFKIGKHSEMIRSWSFMGIWMGLLTTIVGFLTYSIFGNFFHMLLMGDQTGYLYSIPFIGEPLDSLRNPLAILIVALIFGLIHLNIGVVLGIIQSAKQKHYKELATERFCWIPLQLGGGMLIGQFILGLQLNTVLFYIATALVLIGLVLLFIAKGPVGFFDITGYVGDWLSYARLLALGLATAGMALAFNQVSFLLGDMINGIIPIVGIIITILLLLVLHAVNLGLQALGAGVHSLRLQYVEFFNRFYEGGGHEFSPFKVKRRYTKKLEEK